MGTDWIKSWTYLSWWLASRPNDIFTWNFLSALILQDWQWSGKKAIMQIILKVLFKRLHTKKKQSKTAEHQPECAAGGILAAGGLFYSLIRSWVNKLSKNLEEISKFYCQKCNIKQTSYSGTTLQNVVTWHLHTADSIIKLKIHNMWNKTE